MSDLFRTTMDGMSPELNLNRSKLPLCVDITAHIDHRYGGIATTVPKLGSALEETGRYRSRMLAFCDENELQSDSGEHASVLFPFGRLRWLVDRKMQGRLADHVQHADIVHIHGLWQEHCNLARMLCLRFGKPYIISAHGMLDEWSMNHKRLKKNIYFKLFHRQYLSGARRLRALTATEVGDYRRVGLHGPIDVVPNGIDTPPIVGPEVFLTRFQELSQRKILLFLGRLHPKKGVDVLCQAWKRVAPQHRDWHLVLAGPDEGRTEICLREFVRSGALQSTVTFAGMLTGLEKWSALRSSSLFILPSHSEGFSAAVLESLASGCPVVISKACHFPEVVDTKCGWECEDDVDSITSALSTAMAQRSEEMRHMAERGREMVLSRYSWKSVGERAAGMLDRVLQDWEH